MKSKKLLAETMLLDSLNGAGHLDDFSLAIKNGASINFDNMAIEFHKNGKMDAILGINGEARVSGFLAMASKVNAGNLELINAGLSCNANVDLGDPLISMLFHLDRDGVSRDIDSKMGKAIINTIKAGAIIDKPILIYDDNGYKKYENFLSLAKRWNVDDSLCDEIASYSVIPARLRKSTFREKNKDNLEKYVSCHEELQLEGKSPAEQKEVILRACRDGFVGVLQDAINKGIEIEPSTAYKEALSTYNDDVVEFLMDNNIDFNFNSKCKILGARLDFTTENDKLNKSNKLNNTVDGMNYAERLEGDRTFRGGSAGVKGEWEHNLVEGAIRMQNKDVLILALRKGADIEWQDEYTNKDDKDNYSTVIKNISALSLAKECIQPNEANVDLTGILNEFMADKDAFIEKYDKIESDNKIALKELNQENSQAKSNI